MRVLLILFVLNFLFSLLGIEAGERSGYNARFDPAKVLASKKNTSPATPLNVLLYDSHAQLTVTFFVRHTPMLFYRPASCILLRQIIKDIECWLLAAYALFLKPMLEIFCNCHL
jgi:hypothetical protein